MVYCNHFTSADEIGIAWSASEPMSRLTLKSRFLLGLGLMLLPLLVVIGVSFFALEQMTDTFDELAEEAVSEIGPVLSLQERIHEVSIDFHQAVHHEVEARLLERLFPGIDQLYATVLASPFAQREEHDAVLMSHQAWQAAAAGWGRYRDGDRSETQKAAVERQLQQAEQLLGQVRELALSEVGLLHAKQQESRWSLGVFLGTVLILGVGLSAAIGIVFTRAVLKPVRALEAGVRQLGEGEMSARVIQVSHDELGDLARTFNMMAQKLERNHQELTNLSTIDFLTGLHNVREFYRLFHEETRRADRYAHGFSLLVIDVDRFKEINDTFGHQLGDYVLQEVARKLRELTRGSDHVARIGGDEFAVLLPETGAIDAADLAERIRRFFAEHPISQLDHPDAAINMTVSIGQAAYPKDATDANSLFAAADAALYCAKQGGRNKLCQAELRAS